MEHVNNFKLVQGRLENAQIKFCFLTDVNSYEQGSDIDILIEGSLHYLTENISHIFPEYNLLSCYQHEIKARTFILEKDLRFLKLDVYEEYAFNGSFVFNWYSLASSSSTFIADLPYLGDQLQNGYKEVKASLKKHGYLIRPSDEQNPIVLSVSRFLVGRKFMYHKVGQYLSEKAYRKFINIKAKRAIYKKIHVVIVMGPDGVGKSTQIQLLNTKGKEVYRNVEMFHFRPRILLPGRQTRSVDSNVVEPYANRPRSSFVSNLKLLMVVIDYFLFCLKIIIFGRASNLVVIDRSIFDIVADPKRFRIQRSPSILKKLFKFLASGNYFCGVVLSGNSEDIHERKKEVSLEETQKQVEAYEQIVKDYKLYRLDTSCKNEEETGEQLIRLVLSHWGTI